MHAVVTPLDAKRPYYLTDVRRVSWSDFGGPLLCDLGHTIPDGEHDRLRLARVQVFGEWGLCWEGYVTNVLPDVIGASGPNIGYADFRKSFLFCETSTSRWKERTLQTCMRSLEFLNPNGPQLVFSISDGAIITNSGVNGCYIRLPQPNSGLLGARVSFSWARDDTGWRGRLYWGDGPPSTTTGSEVTSWTNYNEFAVAGSGNLTGTTTVSIPNTDARSVLMFYFQWTGSTRTLSGKPYVAFSITNPRIRAEKWPSGTVVASPTSHAVVQSVLANTLIRGNWMTVPDTSLWEMEAVSSLVLQPLSWWEPTTGLDVLAEMVKVSGGRFIWKCESNRCFPSFQAYPTTPRYVVDLRDPSVESEPQGWDASEWATDVQATFKQPGFDSNDWSSNHVDDGFLTPLGVNKWASIDVNTESSTDAAAAALSEVTHLSGARFSGTVTTPNVRTLGGARVPLEHLTPGERVRLLGYDGITSARLIESSVEDGRATLTLDTPLGALDATLASLVSGG